MNQKQNPSQHKSGFAVMIGRSNVGKSTLMNAMVGSKIAITTPKPQTTRLPIQGVLTRDEGQIVFIDTPGLFKNMKDRLTKKLNQSVMDSLEEVDVLLHVVDPTREIGEEEKYVMQILEKIDRPKILVINKMDLQRKPFYDFYKDLSDKYDDVVEVSAANQSHVKPLIEIIFKYLPESVDYYPAGQLTNLSNNLWLAELIREKLFLRLRQEVPYSTHVIVEEMDRREDGMLYIKATIFTTEDRYKRIIIGKGGRGIKEIGQSTRKELEAVMNCKVFLDLTVDVNPHWVEQYL
ncbi:MAG: GTPase Era [Candidatus Uhrbacteria bacterium GW2011_GWE2_40_58]|nr:MAG: GTPase Era [Candidatus Uhrbacteria bacterium GW2011_GWF2_40_263]KKR68110.1 MAG: GTPase Era [Candidatus Uhrbacteria bacterium GW2011_GWE2_40_58]OGL91810.1 MAG: GTPase Era [Candidatus Uhrbacteria bacterium RIFOXYA2_FULL_40_9]OGL97260.1 MAG: GTPase Era [Candidatus Uhrbacteria bacterium RIFOXYB2_FULL_41_18]HBK34432.1 GTPase Era [Candidatus Uhrbacteria bacterium]